MSQIWYQPSLRSLSYHRLRHLENLWSIMLHSWIIGTCIGTWFLRWTIILLLIHASLSHTLHTGCSCTGSLVFDSHMKAFVTIALLAFILLIVSLRLLFGFLRADDLLVPLIDEAYIAALPLWKEFLDLFLSDIVVLCVTMKTCLALKHLHRLLNTLSLFWA